MNHALRRASRASFSSEDEITPFSYDTSAIARPSRASSRADTLPECEPPRTTLGAPATVAVAGRADAEPGELLVDHGRVELGEHRGRLGDRRAGLHRSRLPARGAGVVTGDHRVRAGDRTRAGIEVGDLIDARHRHQLALPAEDRVDPVRGVGQERRKQGVAVAHALGGDVEDRRQPLTILPHRVRQTVTRLAGPFQHLRELRPQMGRGGRCLPAAWLVGHYKRGPRRLRDHGGPAPEPQRLGSDGLLVVGTRLGQHDGQRDCEPGNSRGHGRRCGGHAELRGQPGDSGRGQLAQQEDVDA